MGLLILSAGINNTRSKTELIDEKYKIEEARLTSDFRRLLTKELIRLGVINNYGKEDTRVWSLKHNGIFNLSLDLHFNLSENLIINGTEIVIPYNDSESKLSDLFLKYITDSLKTKSRGIKHECNNYRGQLLFITPSFKNLCIEICFLTNNEDMIKYNNNKSKLIINLATLLKQIL